MKNFNDFISGVNAEMVDEGNAFLAARQKAIEEEQDEFEFGGKTYKVQEGEESSSETSNNEPKVPSHVIRKFSDFIAEDAVADNLEDDDTVTDDIKDDAEKEVEDAEASKDAKEKEAEIEDSEIDAEEEADADGGDDDSLKSDADDAKKK
jgi:hypothetical protein